MFALAELLFLLVSPIFRTWLSFLGWGTGEGNVGLLLVSRRLSLLAPVDGGIMAGLCNQIQDTGRMHVGPWGLELGRVQYTLLPRSIKQQQACAQGALLPSEGERWRAETCVGFVPLNIRSWQNT